MASESRGQDLTLKRPPRRPGVIEDGQRAAVGTGHTGHLTREASSDRDMARKESKGLATGAGGEGSRR